MNPTVTSCKQCILDTSDDPSITFDKNGICSYCTEYKEKERVNVLTEEKGRKMLQQKVEEIKKRGKGKKYDSIIGLSGGVDSSYLALLASRSGLRPLAVHFDNGWNSELAVKNIEQIVKKLNYELYTYVVDWESFKDLQLSYLKAGVVDIEVLTDHAISTVLYKLASQNNIKYILNGANVVTEGILPSNWVYNKGDHVNIKHIHSLYGSIPIRNYPLHNKLLKKYHKKILGIESVYLLNYIPYIKKEVKEILKKELNWIDYGGKHYESVFTRFYQGYILPVKFGIHKRKAHLSTLICSKQITRAEALKELQINDYSPEMAGQDKEYVIKKLGLTEKEFDDIMSSPVKKHTDYKTEQSIFNILLSKKK